MEPDSKRVSLTKPSHRAPEPASGWRDPSTGEIYPSGFPGKSPVPPGIPLRQSGRDHREYSAPGRNAGVFRDKILLLLRSGTGGDHGSLPLLRKPDRRYPDGNSAPGSGEQLHQHRQRFREYRQRAVRPLCGTKKQVDNIRSVPDVRIPGRPQILRGKDRHGYPVPVHRRTFLHRHNYRHDSCPHKTHDLLSLNPEPGAMPGFSA